MSALLGTPETDGELASPLLAIGTLALLEGVAPPPDDIGSLASWVRHVLSEARDPVCGRDRGGVRVLDMMQARGLAFRRVVIAGVHEGALPRIPTEDPFVRHVAGTVTPAASTPPDGPDSDDASDLGEERLLFGLALAAASEEACVTWQRADDAQRPRSLSPFLREVWRAIGDPGPGHDLSAFQRLPTHPALFASQLAAATGLLEPSRALSAIGMLAPTDRSAAVAGVARSLGVMDRGLDAGLRHVAATDAFEARRGREPEDLAFDGWVGEAPSESTRAPMAVSQLDRLGDCPLKHFFGGRLGVRALESPEDELIEPRAIGMAVHGLLKTLYERLPLPWNDTAAVLAEARRLLPALVREALAPVAHGPLLGYDALARAEEGKWRVAVSELLGRDVPLLAERRVREIHVEKEVAQTIAIGPREVLMTGRYDRVATFAAAGEPEEVADYKTGRSAVTRVASAADAIGGRNLQLFVYALIREAESGLLPLISALSVRPLDRRGRPVGAKEVASGTLRAEIRPSVVAAHRVALERTIGTLLDLRARGLFPISPTDESCRFCDFRSACRTSHAPTRARVASAAPFAAYYALSRRSSR
ncbi:MAG: PD-(D/E)XK nuclease family protein [Acidobacteriota bacterium]